MGERIKTKLHAEAALKTRFGANVRDYRRRLALSQEELAWRADMHRTYLADIERGGRNISFCSIVRLVNALGASLAEFFLSFENSPHTPLDSASPRKRGGAADAKSSQAKKRRSSSG